MAGESIASESMINENKSLAGHKRLHDDMGQMVVYSRERKIHAKTAAQHMRDHLVATKEHCSITEKYGLTMLEQLRRRDTLETEAEACKLKHESDILEVAHLRAELNAVPSPAVPPVDSAVPSMVPDGHSIVLKV